jgi:hypothetical protein
MLHEAEDNLHSSAVGDKTDRRFLAAEGGMLERRVPKCGCKLISLLGK